MVTSPKTSKNRRPNSVRSTALSFLVGCYNQKKDESGSSDPTLGDKMIQHGPFQSHRWYETH